MGQSAKMTLKFQFLPVVHFTVIGWECMSCIFWSDKRLWNTFGLKGKGIKLGADTTLMLFQFWQSIFCMHLKDSTVLWQHFRDTLLHFTEELFSMQCTAASWMLVLHKRLYTTCWKVPQQMGYKLCSNKTQENIIVACAIEEITKEKALHRPFSEYCVFITESMSR